MNTKHLFLCAALALAPAALAQDGKNAIAGSCTIDANTPAKLNQNNLLASCNPSVNIPLGKRMVIEQASAVCMFDASGTPPLISRFSGRLPARCTWGLYLRRIYADRVFNEHRGRTE